MREVKVDSYYLVCVIILTWLFWRVRRARSWREALGFKPPLRFDELLDLLPINDTIKVLKEQDDDFRRVQILGAKVSVRYWQIIKPEGVIDCMDISAIGRSGKLLRFLNGECTACAYPAMNPTFRALPPGATPFANQLLVRVREILEERL